MSGYMYDAVMSSRSLIAEMEMTEIKNAIKHTIEKIHAPVSGESIEDHRKYCRTCTDAFGSSKIHPCPTVRKLEKVLKYLESE